MLHGLLLVDKPTGITSHDVVARVRSILKQKAVGHNGTLDPLASGLMVLLLGEATKLSDYFLTGDKGYEVTALFGCETDTLDVTGSILSHRDVVIDPNELSGWLKQLSGEHLWEVPAFSAVKVAGRKLYEYAREDKEVQAPKKVMKFWDIELLGATSNRATVRLKCSKGSYVRSWVSALGRLAGTGAAVETLRRTYSQPFHIDSAMELNRLEEGSADLAGMGAAFMPFDGLLTALKTVTVKGRDERLLGHGQIAFDLERRLIDQVREANAMQATVGVRVLNSQGGFLALIEALPGQGLKIKRVFRPT